MNDGFVAFASRLGYHRDVIPPRERLLQLARLAGLEAFSERFGSPQTADPPLDALRELIEERLDAITRALIEEAAASDDVTDTASAEAYLEDRLATLADLLSNEQADRLREALREGTKAW